MTQMAYNALGQTTVITDAGNRVTRSGYDGQGSVRDLYEEIGTAAAQGMTFYGATRITPPALARA